MNYSPPPTTDPEVLSNLGHSATTTPEFIQKIPEPQQGGIVGPLSNPLNLVVPGLPVVAHGLGHELPGNDLGNDLAHYATTTPEFIQKIPEPQQGGIVGALSNPLNLIVPGLPAVAHGLGHELPGNDLGNDLAISTERLGKSMATPTNAALSIVLPYLPPPVKAAMQAAITAEMTKGAAEQAGAVWDEQDPTKRRQGLMGAGLGLGSAVAGAMADFSPNLGLEIRPAESGMTPDFRMLGPPEYAPQTGPANFAFPEDPSRPGRDDAHPYAPNPDQAGPPPAPDGANQSNASPPPDTQTGSTGAPYAPQPESQFEAEASKNAESDFPSYSPSSPGPVSVENPVSGPPEYAPQGVPSDSSGPSQQSSQSEPSDSANRAEPGTPAVKPSTPVPAPSPSPADAPVEPGLPDSTKPKENVVDQPSAGSIPADVVTKKSPSLQDKELSNFTPSHDPTDSDQADEFEPRLPKRVYRGKTHGVIDLNGKEIYLRSQIAGRGKNFYDPNKSAIEQAATHVEGHAVGVMIHKNLSEMTVTINHRQGPCGSCREQIPDMLPPGKTLKVNWQDEQGIKWTTIFKHGAEPNQVPMNGAQ